MKEGDIFSLDCGATLGGFVGDTATTVPVGQVDEDRLKLIRVTEECLERAIEQCRPGNHLGDIGWAVQEHAEAHGYGIVRDYVGHGIGRKMHEDPQIPNYGKPGTGVKIRAGYVFAIEPMVNMGTHQTKTLKDGWTVVTLDGRPSGARRAHDRRHRGRAGDSDPRWPRPPSRSRSRPRRPAPDKGEVSPAAAWRRAVSCVIIHSLPA